MNTSNPSGINGRNPRKYKGYVSRGYRDAKRASGHLLALEPNLYALYGELREMVERDVEWIKKGMLHCKSEMEKLRREIAELGNIIKKEIEERIPDLQKQIEQLREETADIKNNPGCYLGEKIEKPREKIDRNNLEYAKNEDVVFNKVLPVDDLNKIHIQNGLDKSHNQYLKGWTNRLSDLGKSNVEIKQSCRFAYNCLEKYKYNLLNL